jgi:hypothetical protein
VKDELTQLVKSIPDVADSRHLAREYLQARILYSLQRSGAFLSLAFHGGTALRFVYQIPRYSEDLDFALERAPDQYDFRALLRGIQSDLGAEGYTVEMKVSDAKTVHSAFIRFRGLLYKIGLSPHVDETLAVKIEVDTRPPAGAGLATTIVRRHVVLNLQHHDRPSLLSGKLHAVLQRAYTKGRDLYDLLWYLSDPGWPDPNLVMLNNALAQPGWTGHRITTRNWHRVVWGRLQELDWEAALRDVRPFLMQPDDAEMLTLGNFGRLLVE